MLQILRATGWQLHQPWLLSFWGSTPANAGNDVFSRPLYVANINIKSIAFRLGNQYRKGVHICAKRTATQQSRLNGSGSASTHGVKNERFACHVHSVQEGTNKLRKELTAVLMKVVRPVPKHSAGWEKC